MRCGMSLGESSFWLCTNPLFSVSLQILAWCWTRGRVKVSGQIRWGDSGISGQAVCEKLTLLSISVSLPHSVPCLLFLLLFFFFYFHFNSLRQRLKTSVQLYSTQVPWPFYDFVFCSALSGFTVFTSAQYSREFMSLFLIAVYVKVLSFQ